MRLDWIMGTGRYGLRIPRMLVLLATRRIPWTSFTRSLRSGQVAVPALGPGMVFCDRDTERMAFGEKCKGISRRGARGHSAC